MGRQNKIHRGQAEIRFAGTYSPIGLDIGSANIKLIQLKRTNSLPDLYRHAVIPTPAGLFAEGQLRNPEKLGRILFRLVSKLKLHDRKVNLCLGPQACYLRIIELPSMTKRELIKALPWEVEKHFPLKADEAVYDCCLLSQKSVKESKLLKFILAAAAKKTADSLTEAAFLAGLKPQALEIAPLSLLRSGQIRQKSPAGKSPAPKLLLDIGYSSTTFLVTKDSELQYYRQLRISIADFLNCTADAKGISLQQAQIFLYQTGSLLENGLHEVAGQLAAQINQSIAYWLDHSGGQGSEPMTIYLSGGGASIPGLAHFLQAKLDLKIFQHLISFNTDAKRTAQEKTLLTCPHLFATAYGLALRGWII